jgi:hypothetical protein
VIVIDKAAIWFVLHWLSEDKIDWDSAEIVEPKYLRSTGHRLSYEDYSLDARNNGGRPELSVCARWYFERWPDVIHFDWAPEARIVLDCIMEHADPEIFGSICEASST